MGEVSEICRPKEMVDFVAMAISWVCLKIWQVSLRGIPSFTYIADASFLSCVLRQTSDRYATLDDRFELRHVESSHHRCSATLHTELQVFVCGNVPCVSTALLMLCLKTSLSNIRYTSISTNQLYAWYLERLPYTGPTISHYGRRYR